MVPMVFVAAGFLSAGISAQSAEITLEVGEAVEVTNTGSTTITVTIEVEGLGEVFSAELAPNATEEGLELPNIPELLGVEATVTVETEGGVFEFEAVVGGVPN